MYGYIEPFTKRNRCRWLIVLIQENATKALCIRFHEQTTILPQNEHFLFNENYINTSYNTTFTKNN